MKLDDFDMSESIFVDANIFLSTYPGTIQRTGVPASIFLNG